jgi:hypothetical protein
MRVVDMPIAYAPRWYKDGRKTKSEQGVKSMAKLTFFKLRKIA